MSTTPWFWVGKTVESVQSHLNTFIVYLSILRRIESLSLSVAADKTEVVLFRDRRRLDYVKSPSSANRPFLSTCATIHEIPRGDIGQQT